ncbi:class I SAM-dependent methyltransferase [Ulvibacterium sp.]|uniref:class I SAM-dependent methyltransferase n=1 Tax=Ulvibacterium sp. TaxID=2665914 RepID=UPI003CC5567F
MNSKSLINRDIELFYNRASEETRLEKGMGILEFERVKTLIEKYILSPSSKIVDVGGGTGKYAEWLAKKGHSVHVVEPVEKHCLLAQDRADQLKKPFVVHRGEARNLNFSNNFADVIILHGPLYHLQKKEDRISALREAKRVVRKNGIVLGFAINYTASTLAGLFNGLIHKPAFFDMCRSELTTSVHNPPDAFPWLLAEAFYHRPEGLKAEFQEQELECIHMHAVEGMVWLDKNYFASLNHEKKRKNLMRLLEITENDFGLLPFSPHMMIAAKNTP